MFLHMIQVFNRKGRRGRKADWNHVPRALQWFFFGSGDYARFGALDKPDFGLLGLDFGDYPIPLLFPKPAPGGIISV
jgi:hypothetical protein